MQTMMRLPATSILFLDPMEEIFKLKWMLLNMLLEVLDGLIIVLMELLLLT